MFDDAVPLSLIIHGKMHMMHGQIYILMVESACFPGQIHYFSMVTSSFFTVKSTCFHGEIPIFERKITIFCSASSEISQVLRAARRPGDLAAPPAARHAAAAARLRGGEGLGAAEAVGRRGGRKAGGGAETG